jgi:integrase
MGKGHIRRRSENSWELKYDVAHENGRRTIYKTFRGTKRAAQIELSRLLAQAGEGNHIDSTKLTVAEHVRARFQHWKLTKIILPMTAQRYEELIENNIIPYIGGRPLQRLSTLDIETWHTALMTHGRKGRTGYADKIGGGLSARTIGHAHRILSKAINEAMKHGLVAKNVCTLQRAPKVQAEEMQILTLEQVEALPGLLHGHALEVPALLALNTGMRRGELLALRWGNVDLEKELLRVRESLEQTKAGGLRFKETKTKAGRRDITLPAAAVDLLQAHRKHELERRLMQGLGRLNDNDLVFPSLYGTPGTPWAPNSFGSAWFKLSAELGLGVSFHALRHTHASYLFHLGTVDVVTISKRLGHSSPAITLGIYAHLIQQDDRKAAAAMNKAALV